MHKEPLYERFRKQHPPTFDGSTDPLKAEQWLDMLSSILMFMGIEGNDRVACAVHTFRDDARIWWGVVTQIRDEETMTWEEFREVFYEKYLNDTVRGAKTEEFVGLVQGKLTVTEYVQTFDRLARFAPEMVPTDRARRDKFLRGLNSMIARDVGITMDVARTTYAQVVERALYAERAEDQVTRDLAARREQRKATHGTVTQKGGGPNDQKRKMIESIASGGEKKNQGNWRDYPYCEKCHRYHFGECRPRACYQCGSPDHLKRNCPQQKKEEKKAADSFTPSRVFHLTQSEATDSKIVLTGQLSSAGTLLSVLFDSGETHSFVATRVMDRLCRPGSELDR